MLSEFDLIDRFFLQRARQAKAQGRAAHLGIGDDCALLPGRPGYDYAVSSDMLVSGRHFLPDVDPFRLGHKSLAVNLSDLAAMGATPSGFTLSLALPQAEPLWLDAFSAGLFALAERHNCELVGGDTTAGPLTISITIFGEIPCTQALRRDAARVGDDIWVSGTLGDARLALGLLRQDWINAPLLAVNHHATLAAVLSAMEAPEPRVSVGLALRGIAHAAIDLSDGLVGDLAHILKRSGMAARVNVDAIPRSPWLAAQADDIQRICTLAGGDDYELCFTAPLAVRSRMADISAQCGVALTRIGEIIAPGDAAQPLAAELPVQGVAPRAGQIQWTDGVGMPLTLSLAGFDHFNGN